MDNYESLLSPAFVLNEQIARQIFEVLPEQGPIVLIMDKFGPPSGGLNKAAFAAWTSDPEEFARLNIGESHLKEICAKIDDGDEPVITQVNDCSIIAAQLETASSNCGYIIITLPQYSPESTLSNINLIETLLHQFNLIARLLEQNNLLYEAKRQNHPERLQNRISLN